MILRNDLPRVWEHVKGLRDSRVDFVLDNGEVSSSFCSTQAGTSHSSEEEY